MVLQLCDLELATPSLHTSNTICKSKGIVCLTFLSVAVGSESMNMAGTRMERNSGPDFLAIRPAPHCHAQLNWRDQRAPNHLTQHLGLMSHPSAAPPLSCPPDIITTPWTHRTLHQNHHNSLLFITSLQAIPYRANRFNCSESNTSDTLHCFTPRSSQKTLRQGLKWKQSIWEMFWGVIGTEWGEGVRRWKMAREGWVFRQVTILSTCNFIFGTLQDPHHS